MNVVMVATFAWPEHHGGAERVLGEVSERLAARGHAVTLLTARLSGCAAREARCGVDVRRYDVERGSPLRFYRSVFRGVRAALADPELRGTELLHLHQPLSGLAVLAPGRPLRRPTLLSFYAPYNEEYLARFRDGRGEGGAPLGARAVSALLRHGDRHLLRHADRILVLSEFSRAQVEGLAPEALPRTVVARPGVDLARFRPAAGAAERRDCARRFGLPDDGMPALLSVRRLVPRMGLPDLLEALRLLVARGRGARLLVAGTGPQEEPLRRQAAEAGLAERVRWLGRVEEPLLPELYRAADVFVLPTRALEGFGMATAEALASGLPVVATDAGATRELLDGLRGAALCPAGDPQALAAALEPLLGSSAARADAGREARLRAESALGWEPHLDAIEAQAALALAAHGAAPRADVRRAAPRGGGSP